MDAFYELNTAAHRARKANLIQIPPDVLDPLLYRWKRALLCGLADNPRRPGVKQSKTRNLLSRLTSRDEQVLLFARDLRVAFTNNLAERDLRPAKTQRKSPAATRQRWRPGMATDPWLHLHHAQKRCPRPDRTPRRHHGKPLDPSCSLNGYVFVASVEKVRLGGVSVLVCGCVRSPGPMELSMASRWAITQAQAVRYRSGSRAVKSVVAALEKCWAVVNAPAGKRLAQSGVLGELVPVLREHGEVGRGTPRRGCPPVSAATIDRRLAFARSGRRWSSRCGSPHGCSQGMAP